MNPQDTYLWDLDKMIHKYSKTQGHMDPVVLSDCMSHNRIQGHKGRNHPQTPDGSCLSTSH